jgi:hypothetical protein
MTERVPTLKRAVEEFVAAPRAVLAVALGGPVLLARGLRWVLDNASEEGDRQLERLRSRLQKAPEQGDRPA